MWCKCKLNFLTFSFKFSNRWIKWHPITQLNIKHCGPVQSLSGGVLLNFRNCITCNQSLPQPSRRSRRCTEKRNRELERDISLAQNKVVNKSSAWSSHSHSCTSSRRRSCTIWNNNATFCNTDKAGKSTVKGEFLLILQCNYGYVYKPVCLNTSFLKSRVQIPATVKRAGFMFFYVFFSF